MKVFQQIRRLRRARRMPLNKPTHSDDSQALLQETLGYPVQTRLRVGEPNDAYEREADLLADRVMATSEASLQRSTADPEQEDEQKKKETEQPALEEEEKKDEEAQRKSVGGEVTLSSAGAAAIGAKQGGGHSLPSSERAFFEPRMGANFGRVRLHADSEAARLSAGLSARAFTVGGDVFFGQGEYQPGTASGRRLLAHELTHVLQQSRGAKADDRSDDRREVPGTENDVIRRQAIGASASAAAPMVMRSMIFSGPFRIALRCMNSRSFSISRGSIRVSADASYRNPAACGRREYSIELKEKGALGDTSHGSRRYPYGASHTETWSDLPTDKTFYLFIWIHDPPMQSDVCALEGNVTVEE